MAELLVSTVIPTYNRADLIARAVESALRESRPGDEIIVVDDGSTDRTEEVLAPFRDRIVYARLPHAGAGVTRNQGVKLARNDLVAFLDSDDEWMPGKLELRRRFMQARPDVLFSFSDFAVKNSQGVEEHHYLQKWHGDSRRWDEILSPGFPYSSVAELPPGLPDFKIHVGSLYRLELTANYIFAGTLTVRRKDAGEALHFGEGLPTYEDWECFGRLSRKGSGAYLDCETAWQISHSGDRLTRADTLDTATARISLIERVWGSDEDFLEENSALYRNVLAEQRLLKVKGYLARGDTKGARAEVKLVDGAPLAYKLMASMPSWLAAGIVGLKRTVSGDK